MQERVENMILGVEGEYRAEGVEEGVVSAEVYRLMRERAERGKWALPEASLYHRLTLRKVGGGCGRYLCEELLKEKRTD